MAKFMSVDILLRTSTTDTWDQEQFFGLQSKSTDSRIFEKVLSRSVDLKMNSRL